MKELKKQTETLVKALEIYTYFGNSGSSFNKEQLLKIKAKIEFEANEWCQKQDEAVYVNVEFRDFVTDKCMLDCDLLPFSILDYSFEIQKIEIIENTNLLEQQVKIWINPVR